MATGHKRSACTAGMAEWTPKALASYEAAQTTTADQSFDQGKTTTGFCRMYHAGIHDRLVSARIAQGLVFSPALSSVRRCSFSASANRTESRQAPPDPNQVSLQDQQHFIDCNSAPEQVLTHP